MVAQSIPAGTCGGNWATAAPWGGGRTIMPTTAMRPSRACAELLHGSRPDQWPRDGINGRRRAKSALGERRLHDVSWQDVTVVLRPPRGVPLPPAHGP